MMRATVKPVRDREAGAIAVVAGILMIVIIGMAALVVDGGYLAMRKRAMQSVADAAALAGGIALPISSSAAIADARTNATANGYTNGASGATVTVNSPYSSDSTQIEVIVSKSVSTFLAAALKINAGLVTGRAVAKMVPAPETIFAGDGSCSGTGVQLSGTNFTINGDIHSDGTLAVAGDATDKVTGNLEYGNGCSGTKNGPVVASSPVQVANENYPFSYTAASFTCTTTQTGSGVWNLCNTPGYWASGSCGGTGGALKAGVYCSTGTNGVQLNGNGLSGNVTIVSAGNIEISGQNLNMTAYQNGIFLYTSYAPPAGSTAIVMGSQNLTWSGAIFAPNGLVNISGTTVNISNGSIVGNDVQLGATSWTMTGSTGSGAPYLIE